ncbi:hypothetical protein CYMTET_24994 [Cymbomonas tetramitiformis]|uniref:Uncharacterized protein n=1 Tax=Cymbomonas tetramitiformis TaxID=36881 RepID=A0AAE0KZC8_9CHLO|nr:hypothetical protein CYMTET_24994 [Cymbomonas tetramitiformis]
MPGVDYFDIQENTFRRWCNDYLSGTGNGKTTPTGRFINNLKEDLKDGVALIELLEVLSGKPVGKYNKHPKLDIQKMENLSLAIAFISAQGIKLVNISAEDICSGNMRLILGLIWTLILRFEINQGGDDKEAADGLLKWVQSKIPEYGVKGFTKDWNDGRALCALVNALLPSELTNHRDLDPANKEENLRTGMDVALSNLAIDKLLLPEEMAHPKVDKLAVMTYIAQFRNISQADLAKLGEHTLTKAYGPGLVEGILGQEARFEVHTPDGCATAPTIAITPATTPTLTSKGAGQHDVVYVPDAVGKFEVGVMLNGNHIPGSPFQVVVLEQESLGGEGKIRVFFSTTHSSEVARATVTDLSTLLEAKKVHLRKDFEPWHPVDLMAKDDRDAVFRKAGTRNLPIVFVDDKYIGDYDTLRVLEEQGKLDGLLCIKEREGDLMTVDEHIQRLKNVTVSGEDSKPADAPVPRAASAPAEPAKPQSLAPAPKPAAPAPAPAAPAVDIASGSSTSEVIYSLAQLQGDVSGLAGVDPAKREAYLSDQEFHSVFGMLKEEFYKLPKWKQAQPKKNTGLF